MKDRVRELRRVKASSIAESPLNARTHPPDQLAALSGAMADLGMASAILTYEREDGTLQCLDGHARLKLLGDAEVPVLVLDLDDQEAKKLLLTFDALGSMANYDAEMLGLLAEQVNFESDAVNEMIACLLADVTPPAPEPPESKPDKPASDSETHGIWFNDSQWLTISAAIAKFRDNEHDETLSGSTCCEMILADWLAGQ